MEYKTPYQKPIFPVAILEGHYDDDDQSCGSQDWNSTFFKSTTERMKNNPGMYPPFNIVADIFNNDESDYEDAKSEETDSQDTVDDSEYDPEEDAHDIDGENSEEEFTCAGDHEEGLSEQDLNVCHS